MSEIVTQRLDGRALPQRRARGAAEPVDVRLLRTIAAALPADLPPVRVAAGSSARIET